MEDLINPLATALYEQYGFLNPAQLGILSQSQNQTAQASTQYQDAFTLDRLVGTTRAILRDAHYDGDIPILESILGDVFGDYKNILVSAGVHLAQVARTFQDYGQGRQVSLAGADIRSSSTLHTISSTTYVLETGAALLNAKQLLQQSAYTHTISDLYQLFSQCSFYRAELETHQSNRLLIHANDYEVSAASVTEQAGKRILYADDLLITVGADEPFNSEVGFLRVSAKKADFAVDELTVSTEKIVQNSKQLDVHSDRLNLSGGTTTLYGSSNNVGAAGVMRISGSPVMINGARVAAPGRVPIDVLERHKPAKFVEIPIYNKTPLLQTQSAGGIDVGGQEVVSPPQGTAGAYSGVSPAGRIGTSPVTSPVHNRNEDLSDESLSRPTL